MILTPDNVAGLVVGEGCFYVESAPNSKYRLGWRIRPGFCIEMRHDEREVLAAVRDILGCGSLYELDFGRYQGYESKGWQPHVKYRVTRLSDLHDRVIPFFTRHRLFGRKEMAFDLFAEIVRGLVGRRHSHKSGLMELQELAAQLKEHNARGHGLIQTG